MLYFSFKVLSLPVATVLLLIFLYAKIMPLFSSILQDYQLFLNFLPAFNLINQIQTRCEKNTEIKTKTPESVSMGNSICLKNVSFSYEPGTMITHDIDLIISKGEHISIVGVSGSGKSTIADLIMGLILPDKGSILIDGLPLTANKIESWRNQIGYVAQDTFLFHDTIRANLLWAYPSASQNELFEALNQSACMEFISRLPNDIETIVGDRGVRLSGGERQRIALARALLRKPSLLILDEATSSLDSENEKRIQSAIEELHIDRRMTILTISHRLSSVSNSGKIYVLEKGQIVESGNWNELMRNENGKFYKLCLAQEINLKHVQEPIFV